MLAPDRKPDRDQIEIFVDAMFRHAGEQGFVSLRAFYEDDDAKPFRINATALSGGLRFLVDVAEDDASRAANYPKPVVFCPPIAVFSSKDHARERDLAEGLALSVECDQHPHTARAKLEAILGPATMVVRSGGKWTDPATREIHDKLHLHWRLRAPARGEALPRLKQARDIAARFVGGDPSNKPVCHPIRWPGSWHRKAEPVMCEIETASPDCEIDLDAALAALAAACPLPPREKANGKDHSGPMADWTAQVQSIISGDGYHAALTSLAAKMLVAGMSDGAAVNMLRGLMECSAAPHDDRWRARYDDIPRAVSSAREKFGNSEGSANATPPHGANGGEASETSAKPSRIKLIPFDDLKPSTEPEHLVKGLIPRAGLVVVWGPPKCGKSFWTMDAVLHVALGWEYRGRNTVKGPVVYCAFEGQTGYGKRAEAFRLRKLCAAHTDPVPFHLVAAPMNFGAQYRELIDAIRLGADAKPVVVVLDTLNRSLVGSESDDKDMAAYLRAADAVRDTFDCCVVIVHHCGVDASRPRGHTSLTGAVDAQLAVKRDTAGNVIVEVEWMKDGEEGDKVASRFEVVEVATDSNGQAISSCVMVPADDVSAAASAKPARMPKTAQTALKALKEAVAECGEAAPASNHIPANVRVTTIERWRQYAYKFGISSGEERAKQKAFKSAFDYLNGSNEAAVWDNHVWLAK